MSQYTDLKSLINEKVNTNGVQGITGSVLNTVLNDMADFAEGKQDALVSGQTLKTVNNQSLLGSGNIESEAYASGIADESLQVVDSYGDIKAGTPLSEINGMTFSQIFDAMLFPTVLPVLTEPSATLALTGSSLREIGLAAPTDAAFKKVFNGGAITVNEVKQSDRAGALRDASYIYANGNSASQSLPNLVALGRTTYTWRAYYAEGSQPYDNKGNAYGSPLPAGYVDSPAVSVYGTYPWFASTSGSVEGDPRKQSLIRWDETPGAMTSPEFTLLPTATCEQVISTPREISNIYIKDANSGNFIEGDLSAYDVSQETRSINGYDRIYYVYRYIGAARGSIILKIKF